MSQLPAAASPPWIDLPLDLTANILQRLNVYDRLERAQLVCTTWWKVCQDPALWRVIDFRFIASDHLKARCVDIFRSAVNRSQGQLIEFDFWFYCNNELLHFIADRSPHLRSLGLYIVSGGTSGNAIAEAAKKLPNLEELHILSRVSIDPQHIESIANSCPLLKSFALRDGSHRSHSENALAIAKHMPNLYYLDAGLEAILDGKRCVQIKHFEDNGDFLLKGFSECFGVSSIRITK